MRTITTISLLLTIINPYLAGGVNSTGNTSFNNIAQVSYEYTVDETVYNVSAAIDLPFFSGSGDVAVPMVFNMIIRVNFNDPVETANFTIELWPTYQNYRNINVISEYCRVVINSPSQLNITAYNTDFCYIKIIYSFEDLDELYDFNRTVSVADNEWINNGKDYVYVNRYNLYSCTLSTSPNYTTQLTSLLNQTDGLEGQLTNIYNSILTNNSTLSTISTNIDDLETYLNNALTKLDTINTNITGINTYLGQIKTLLEQLLTPVQNNYNLDIYTLGVNATYDHRLKLDWSDIRNKTIVPISNLNNSSEYILPENKPYKIVINMNNAISDHDVYYVYLPTGLTGTTQSISLYIYDIEDNGIYKVEFGLRATQVDNVNLPTFKIKMSFLSFTNYQITEYNRIDGKINGVAYTLDDLSLEEMQLSTNQKLDMILDILDDMTISQTDMSDKEAVDQFYEQMKEQLVFPDLPEAPTNFIRDFRGIIDTVKYIVTDDSLSGYIYAMLCYGIFVLFKVVIG